MYIHTIVQSIVVLVCACLVTYFLVISGLDWKYFLFTYNEYTCPFLFLTDGLGFVIPITVPLFLFWYARRKNNLFFRHGGVAVVVSVVLGFVLSMCIKVFTGRISPPHHGPYDVDISGMFQFGFMEHHIMGGWPSSHATVMFALASCLYIVFPNHKKLHFLIFSVAFFVGIGVTFGFHWLSEFIAGACFGTMIGLAVGRAFKNRVEN